MSKEIALQVKRCREEWFPKHKAAFHTFAQVDGHDHVHRMTWYQDGNSNYLCWYLIHGHFLTVFGDIGQATYAWNERISWEFLKCCDFSYFLGKCQASEVGRDYKQWDSRRLVERLREFLSERGRMTGKASMLMEECRGTTNSFEWMEIARRYTNILGPDYWEFGDWGQIPNCRAVGHWVGIQMAMGNNKAFEYYE